MLREITLWCCRCTAVLLLLFNASRLRDLVPRRSRCVIRHSVGVVALVLIARELSLQRGCLVVTAGPHGVSDALSTLLIANVLDLYALTG